MSESPIRGKFCPHKFDAMGGWVGGGGRWRGLVAELVYDEAGGRVGWVIGHVRETREREKRRG
jgi:hypothetical protein